MLGISIEFGEGKRESEERQKEALFATIRRFNPKIAFRNG